MSSFWELRTFGSDIHLIGRCPSSSSLAVITPSQRQMISFQHKIGGRTLKVSPLSSLGLPDIKVNPAGSDPNLHVVGGDLTTLDTHTHSGPTVRPSRKMPKGERVHVKKKCT